MCTEGFLKPVEKTKTEILGNSPNNIIRYLEEILLKQVKIKKTSYLYKRKRIYLLYATNKTPQGMCIDV